MSDREDRPAGHWIDISRPLHNGIPVWPGDLPFIREEGQFEELVLSRFSTTCHVGTHVDAPKHLDPEADPVDRIPLDRLIGPAEVVVAGGAPQRVSLEHLPAGWAPRAPRVLVRTDTHPAGSTTIGPGLAGLAAELVEALAGHGVVLIGIDTPSVDPFEATELTAHHALARNGITWIEGLALEGVAPGGYDLVALPLPLVGAEAAPVRAVLKARREE